MASIDKRGATYVVRWRVGKGSRQRTFHTRALAQDFKVQVESEQSAGRAVDPVSSRTTFKDWYATYAAGRLDVKPQTRATSKSLYDNHVNRWDGWALDSIRQPDVQAWVSEMVGKGKHSASTIHAVYKEFASAMRAAVAARYLRDSPCVSINLPRVERDSMTVLDHAEIAKVADSINPRYRALVLVLAYGGLRIGEACALVWDDVDLVKGTVTVRHTLVELAGEGLTLSRPKTQAARRTVPLPAAVVDALKTHKADYPANYVFTTSTGAPVNPRAFNRRSFSTALKKAGLDCRVHDLRHTAISIWIRSGVDLPRVKAWAGHTDAAFTLNTYAKFFPTDDAGVMAMLNQGIVVK